MINYNYISDFKELKEEPNPAFYIHVIEKMKWKIIDLFQTSERRLMIYIIIEVHYQIIDHIIDIAIL